MTDHPASWPSASGQATARTRLPRLTPSRATADEVDRGDVVAGGVEVTLQDVMELHEVQARETAGVLGSQLAGQREISHAPEHAAIGRLGDRHPAGVKLAEGVLVEALGRELGADLRHEVGAQGAQLPGADIGAKTPRTGCRRA